MESRVAVIRALVGGYPMMNVASKLDGGSLGSIEISSIYVRTSGLSASLFYLFRLPVGPTDREFGDLKRVKGAYYSVC